MPTCNLTFPGNPLATANVTVNGDQATITGSDTMLGIPFHTSTLRVDANSSGYSLNDRWYGGLLGNGTASAPGGRPVSTQTAHMGNEVKACGINLRNAGHVAEGNLLIRIGNQIRNGRVEK